MPTDRPTAAELVEAVQCFLMDQVRPNTQGQLSFHARVAANALGIVARELQDGAAMDAAEQARLQALLQRQGSLTELNRELSRQIRSGALDDRRREVLAHLRQTSADKLQLANPGYRKPR